MKIYEGRDKLGRFIKGFNPWKYKEVPSKRPEVRERIRKTLQGRKNPEHSKWLKEYYKTHLHPLFGKKRPDMQGNTYGYTKYHKPWNTGKKWSEEIKLKFSNSHKKKIPWNKGIKCTEKEKKRLAEIRLKAIVPVKDTKIEKKIQKLLKELKINYNRHKVIDIPHKYQCDIFIEPNIVIECDGDYWHSYPIGREIDRLRTIEMQERGYKVLRFWERDINYNIEECTNKIINEIEVKV